MSFDGICIRALVDHLQNKIIGGRVDRIHQPDKYTLLLNIRMPGDNLRLLLSAHPQNGRFHLTQESRENPPEPPMFCMVLRKHLEGAKLVNIHQLGLERVVHFTFNVLDEYGLPAEKILIGEFMGKHSNLILINPQKNLILDSIKRVDHHLNQYREILPGVKYLEPPPQNKLNLLNICQEQFINDLHQRPAHKSISKNLIDMLSGIGPQTALELTYRAGLDNQTTIESLGENEKNRLWQSISWLQDTIHHKNYQSVFIEDSHHNLIAFAPFPLKQFQQWPQKKFADINLLIENALNIQENANLFNQKIINLQRIITKELDKNAKKLSLQLDKIAQGEKAEQFRIWGELITANLYHLKQAEKALVPNFYSERAELVEIPLDPLISPNKNAQNYFKKYNKAKTGMIKAKEQIIIVQEEIDYLESIDSSLQSLESIQDIQGVSEELINADYLKLKQKKFKKSKKEAFRIKPLTINYLGWTVLIGKNNLQNDYITFKLAKNNDLWLHVRGIPGSHVIIKNPQKAEIPEAVLQTIASWAAYYSQSRYSSQVPVDYTLKKNVKKISGAKPGMVTYEQQKTIFVTPHQEDKVQ